MTTAHADTRTPFRRTRRAAASAVALSTLLVGASACASESDSPDTATDSTETDVVPGEFVATAAYLHQAADQSAAEGYRMDVLFSFTEEVDETAPPLMTGVIDGDDYHMTMDLGTMMTQLSDQLGEPMPPEVASLDMTMEMAGDLESLYLRAPMFATLAGAPGAGGDPAADLAAIGDGWGYVDLTALGDQLPADLAAALGGQGVDPQATIDIIRDAENVEDLGAGEVQGEPVQGLAAEVTMADLMEASGQDAGALADLGSVDGDDTIDELYGTATTIEVWIDEDGFLRRMAFGFGTDDLAGALGEDAAAMGAAGLGDLHFSYAMDMYDYGATVDFEVPPDTVDITDEYLALIQS
jgi:hypothetical protein